MNDQLPSDDESRRLIAEELDTNFLVEAAAGTGKTTSMVTRMVNLIASGRCAIENLAAVTFTRKAAAELRERFYASARDATKSERPAVELSRLQVAVARIDSAFVGTFHAFCSVLLRERPIECNVDPVFREIEEHEDAQLREEAWRSFIDNLYANQDGRLDQVHELGLKTADLRNYFHRFVDFPDVSQWPHSPPDEGDLDFIVRQVRDYVTHIESIAKQFPTERGTDKLMARYENIMRTAHNTNWDRRGEFFDLLELFDTSHGATQSAWHDRGVGRTEKQRFEEFRATVKTALSWWYGYRYEFVIELLQQAQGSYERLRRISGGLHFQDLLIRTAEALREQPKLRQYFQSRYTHLLVDEFQDTDPVQAEILAYLTAENTAERNWQDCRPRPGSLFLVGDPKQSIYRFRRADIVTYQQVKTLLISRESQAGDEPQSKSGKVIPLTKSFRSVAEIRTWTNRVFDSMIGSDETDFSPRFVKMQPGREDKLDGELKGVFQIQIPQHLGRRPAVEHEADAIARYIRHAIDSHSTVPRTTQEIAAGKPNVVAAGDFMIVTRYKAFLREYGAALDRYGVPNLVTGARVFRELHELRLLIDALKAIDDPRNPVAYVALLRGQPFGFSDADLFELKKCGGRFSPTQPLPESLESGLRQRFAAANEKLASYLGWLRSLPFPSAVARILSDLGLLAQAAARETGNAVTGGLLTALECLRGQSWNFDSTEDVISFLEGLQDDSETEGVTALPPPDSFVRVMNLHKVKGLESPVVFLAGTAGERRHDPKFHVDRRRSQAQGYLAITKQHGQYHTRPIAQPSDWDHFASLETQFDEAEKRRLLYVAATRAACQLVVSTVPGKRPESCPWGSLYGHLADAGVLEIPKQAQRPQSRPPASTWSDSTGQDIADRWQRGLESGYAIVAAKEVALRGLQRPNWHASGNYGQKWGSAIHELLEIRSRRPEANLVAHAHRLAEQWELGADRVDEMVATVDSVVVSQTWQRASQAERRFAELSFELPAEITADGGRPTISRGVIDLVFKEPQGWVLVDYKTDDLLEIELESAAGFYKHQLDSYARAWTELVGEPVIERGLLFTKPGKYCVV